jgi:heat shock protein HslJ
MLHKKVLGIVLASWMALSGCTFVITPETSTNGDSTPVPQEEGSRPANVQAEFVLPDGTSCLFAGTGATIAFDDKRVNYTCEPVSAKEGSTEEGTTLGLLGDPIVIGPREYAVELATIGRNSAGDAFELRASQVMSYTVWEVTLEDGRVCTHAGFGTMISFGDGPERNYACDKGDSTADEVGLMGELMPQGEGVWLAQVDEIDSTESGYEQLSSTQVAVAKVSGVSVTPRADEGRESVGEDAPVDSELVGTTWQWIETAYSDDSVLTVTDPSRYTLTLNADGTLSAQVDCNGGSGTYTLDGASLTFGPLVTTRMGCPAGSQAGVFTKDLAAVASYVIEDGNLHLALAMDSGIMEFAPVQ